MSAEENKVYIQLHFQNLAKPKQTQMLQQWGIAATKDEFNYFIGSLHEAMELHRKDMPSGCGFLVCTEECDLFWSCDAKGRLRLNKESMEWAASDLVEHPIVIAPTKE